jgi:hypothetical protein
MVLVRASDVEHRGIDDTVREFSRRDFRLSACASQREKKQQEGRHSDGPP